ncbi:hypothetical protein LQW54_005752 [Pestalotiopsis sp. IQ-011]
MSIMNLTLCANGLDELSWSLIYSAIQMAQQLSLFAPSPESDPKWQTAAAITSWSVFNMQAFHMFRSPPLLDPPSHHLPEVEHDAAFFGEVHVRYPGSTQAVDVHHGHVFKATSVFRTILNAASLEVFASEGGRLLAIFATEELPHPGNVVMQSKRSLETLIRLYYLRHGFESYDPTMIFFVSLLAWNSLRDYKQLISLDPKSPHSDETLSTLVLCAKFLWEQGANHFLSEVVFFLLKSSLPSRHEVRHLREVVDAEEDAGPRLALMVQEVRSEWPVGIFSTTKVSAEDTKLSWFIAWCEQTIEGQTQRVRAASQSPEQPASPDAGWTPYPRGASL